MIAKRLYDVAIASLLLLALSHPSPAVGAVPPPKAFRTLTWGSPPGEGLKRFASPTASVTMYVPKAGKALAYLFGVPVAEEAYSFSSGRFYSGSAWLDGRDNLVRMRAALTKEFGRPTFANEGLQLWKWKWPGSQVEVHLSYQSRFARTTVTFLNNAI